MGQPFIAALDAGILARFGFEVPLRPTRVPPLSYPAVVRLRASTSSARALSPSKGSRTLSAQWPRKRVVQQRNDVVVVILDVKPVTPE